MRRVLGGILLLCLGMVLPVSAASRCVCLKEAVALEEIDCCPDCTAPSGETDDCCVEIRKLPDSPLPLLGTALPPLTILDVFQVKCPVNDLLEAEPLVCLWKQAIRGPTSPAAFRAVLAIWRV